MKEKEGDLQQIRAIRTLYNQKLEAKEYLVTQSASMRLSPQQLIEIELKLCLVTGEIKDMDAHIHRLMFNESVTPKECAPLSIMELNKIYYRQLFSRQKTMLSRYKTLLNRKEVEINSLKNKLYNGQGVAAVLENEKTE